MPLGGRAVHVDVPHLQKTLPFQSTSTIIVKFINKTTTMSDPCIAINGAGIAYREFSCDYPQLGRFYFE
jgi:hypothetical protein